MYGQGTTKDFPKALQYLQAAASKNYAGSLHLLGLIYSDGIHVPVDTEKALRYFFAALSQYHENRECNLHAQTFTSFLWKYDVKWEAKYHPFWPTFSRVAEFGEDGQEVERSSGVKKAKRETRVVKLVFKNQVVCLMLVSKHRRDSKLEFTKHLVRDIALKIIEHLAFTWRKYSLPL